jgi:hypothetical protein
MNKIGSRVKIAIDTNAYTAFLAGNESIRDKRVTLGEIDENVARIYGAIHTKLRKIGKPIPSNDMWIAATCIE